MKILIIALLLISCASEPENLRGVWAKGNDFLYLDQDKYVLFLENDWQKGTISISGENILLTPDGTEIGRKIPFNLKGEDLKLSLSQTQEITLRRL